MPPLNALRAFEVAARHLSLTKAAVELHVTPGALSHQIRGLEELLGLKLFERQVRAIALTVAGKQLYPGLQTGFIHIQEAVAGLSDVANTRVLVISTPPGFTAKWLAPRLHRFSAAHPDIDVRVSSSMSFANFRSDGIAVAVRTLPIDVASNAELAIEKLLDLSFIPVCSPRLLAMHGPFSSAQALKELPLIHDDSRGDMAGWPEWFKAAGAINLDVSRGLRFSSADHALDAVIEGAGVFLAHDVLAYDELRTGRLVIPFDLKLPAGRAYHLVCANVRQSQPNVLAFRSWIKQEISALDWSRCASC
jgi:LysR family transcriptional regulator, glycine cleavage system transcriptional activator